MKYLFFMIAFATMLANIFVAIQAVKLRKKIKRAESIKLQDQITFYLPKREQSGSKDHTEGKCEDTILLDMEV